MFVLSLTFVHGSAAGGVHIGVNVSFRQIGSCLRIEEQTGLESMPTGCISTKAGMWREETQTS